MSATNTIETLPSEAEQKAKASETLPTFKGLNLTHIRRQVSQMLGMIGRDGIFDEYTTHDISHIDKMLVSLDWLIPEATKKIMSPVDWLMIVLSIYFHDLGMLVTKREFDSRQSSDFPAFRDNILFAGAEGKDYRAKVNQLPADRIDRFLYQDFVRHKHAERVKAWVMGDARPDLGITIDTAKAINELLTPLGEQFRRDLGLICESHHLSDLDNLQKYKVSQPYGDSDDATANLQYCAVLLRTSDLLHVTSDRTPSIAFKVINPTDPISQQEWAKQAAVTRLRPKIALNSDGVADEAVPKDTIEVHAYFANPDGFFGLTSYLAYTNSELKKSNEWISNTRKLGKAKCDFPWRRIDDSNIETKGFLRESFEFAIDQKKILDLLTGHTLYNDTKVVLRELVQNAIDAIRVHCYPDPPGDLGKVLVHWDTTTRTLIVRDNGTGMSQSVISNFLLRVGSSRYQDPEFRKKYPEFTSISRFGIGVLSTFMIADTVEIKTVSPEDDEARLLTLRSVHGKYLVQTLTKTEPTIRKIGAHGTEIKLVVRASVKVADILETARLWIVVPGCDVQVQVDSDSPIRVGHASPADALKAILLKLGVDSHIGLDTNSPNSKSRASNTRVLESTLEGVSVAYAVRWSEYYREWAFLSAPDTRAGRDFTLGICIEGIRVEMGTPGFSGFPFFSLANVTGPLAPRTNVARSGLEVTPERDRMLQRVYGIYSDHISREIDELRAKRGFSLTWAVQEGRYLVQLFSNARTNARATNPQLLDEAIAGVRFLLVEHDGRREAISPKDLADEPEFWTVESPVLDWAEPLIREVETSASLSSVITALKLSKYELPNSRILCGVRSHETAATHALKNREVSKIVVHRDQRRADLQWRSKTSPARWLGLPDLPRELSDVFRDEGRRGRIGKVNQVFYCTTDLEVSGLANETAVKAFDHLLILADTSVAKFLASSRSAAMSNGSLDSLAGLAFTFRTVQECYAYGEKVPDAEDFVQRSLRRIESEYLTPTRFEQVSNYKGLLKLVEDETWIVFDPAAGRRPGAE